MFVLLFISSLAFAESPEPVVETPKTEVVEKAEEVDSKGTEGAKEPSKEEPKKEQAEPEKTKEPSDYNEAAETVSLLVKAVQEKNWALVIGLLLTLLVFVANKFGLKDKVGPKAVPWVATGLATAASLGISLANGLPVTDAISQGVLAGLTAIGGWEMLFKHVLGSKKVEE